MEKWEIKIGDNGYGVYDSREEAVAGLFDMDNISGIAGYDQEFDFFDLYDGTQVYIRKVDVLNRFKPASSVVDKYIGSLDRLQDLEHWVLSLLDGYRVDDFDVDFLEGLMDDLIVAQSAIVFKISSLLKDEE